MKHIVIGIDPGSKGCACAMRIDGSAPPAIDLCDLSDIDLCDWLRSLYEAAKIDGVRIHAFVEHVSGFVPGRPQPASRAFILGQSYGRALGILEAIKMPYERVSPVVWQREFMQARSGESYAERKRRIARIARQLFPSQKITLARADSLIIAEYGRRVLAHRDGGAK